MKEYAILQKDYEISDDNYILIDRITVSNEGAWNCPAQVLVIYGHDNDIDYTDIFTSKNQISQLDDCKNLDTLERICMSSDHLPPLLPRSQLVTAEI